MKALIKIHRERLISSSPRFNSDLRDLTIEAEFFVRPNVRREYPLRIYQPDASFISLPMAQQIASLLTEDGESISIPLFMLIDSPTDNVPSDVIGYQDGDGNQRTWNDWKLNNYEFLERGGNIYLGTNAHTGNDLTFDQLGNTITLVRPSDLPSE